MTAMIRSASTSLGTPTRAARASTRSSAGSVGWTAIALLGMLLSPISPLSPAVATAAECTQKWQAYPESSPLAPGFPNDDANYYYFLFPSDGSRWKDISIRLSADFPYARYRSYTLYDDQIRTVDLRHDHQIAAEPGSFNPYVPGVPRDITPRRHVLWIVPHDSDRPDGPNTLRMEPGKDLHNLTLRTYRPDDGIDETGGVPLPTIELFNDKSGQPMSCWWGDRSGGIPDGEAPDWDAVTPRPVVHAYSASGEGQASNGSPYLGAPIFFSAQYGEVVVMDFKVPNWPDTRAGGGTLPSDLDIRYYNVCMVNARTTTTDRCVRDDEFGVQAGGWARVAVGPGSLRSLAESRGFVFFEWPTLYNYPMLLFRQILPEASFAGSFATVPLFDWDAAKDDMDGELEAKAADRWVGDYGPVGRYCTIAEFESDSCGF